MKHVGSRALASAAVAACLALTSVATAVAQDPSPTPSPPAAPAALTPDSTPSGPLISAVGQSVAIGLTTDAQPQGAGSRLAVTQITVQGTGSGSLGVPMSDSGLRYLNQLGSVPYESGEAQFDFPDVTGYALARTMSAVTADPPLPLSVSARFTLDGEEVSPGDLVGANGVVTAEYTVVNNTTQTVPTQFENVQGTQETRDVVSDQPFVFTATTSLPQRFSGLNPGSGSVGADGMGSNVVIWVGTPFRPLSSDGTASFGWAANVVDGEVPALTIQAAPLYKPDGVALDEKGTALAAPSLPGFPRSRPTLAGGNAADAFAGPLGTATAGAQEMVAGISASARTVGGAAKTTGEGVRVATGDISASLEQICSPDLLDCSNLGGGVSVNLGVVAQDLTGAAQRARDISGQLGSVAYSLQTPIDQLNASGASNYAQLVSQLQTASIALRAGSQVTGVGVTALNSSSNYINEAAPHCRTWGGTIANCAALSAQPGLNAVAAGSLQVLGNQLQGAADSISTVAGQLPSAAAVSQAEVATLTGVQNLLYGLQRDVNGSAAALDQIAGSVLGLQALIEGLKPPFNLMRAGISEIGAAVAGGLDQLADLRNTVPTIVNGSGELRGGVGALSTEARGFLGEVVTVALATKNQLVTTAVNAEGVVETKVTDLGQRANDIKAQAAALDNATRLSPLLYGGLVATPQAGQATTAPPGSDPSGAGGVTPPVDGSTALPAGDTASSAPESSTAEGSSDLAPIPVVQVAGAYEFSLSPTTRFTRDNRAVIVGSGLAFAAALVGGWLLTRRLRRWDEEPL